MNILWVVNTVFPDPSKELGIPNPVLGGWMYGLAKAISKYEDVNMAIATTYPNNEFKRFQISGIDYFLIPCKDKARYNSSLESFWESICFDFKPDVVHIHGTEYAHGLACIRKLPNLKYVISIQGLVSVYSRYYYAGISILEILSCITLRDLIKFDSIFQGKRGFVTRGSLEKEYFASSNHTIGRTNWDNVHSKVINPNIRYHFCNESLRNGFYSANKWDFASCHPLSIFLSQASYPIKGLHQVIKAVSLLKTEFPHLKIRIGGHNITKTETLLDKIKFTGYGKYIKRLIEKFDLEGHITFLGPLTESQMILEYQKANVFICPSSIENSPNSLGEAQIIGVPVIASYTGGTPEMIVNGETGFLYRFEEFEIMADYIKQIFLDNELALKISQKSIIQASMRHDRDVNLVKTISIYKEIINGN
jgi:glycosyltransferase involved in cell wall biosynthesis